MGQDAPYIVPRQRGFRSEAGADFKGARIDRSARGAKLARLRKGASPRVLDLFAGCGGMSLGFHAAGFSLAGAVEFDPLAAASHARNFFSAASARVRSAHAEPRDITRTSSAALAREFGFDDTGHAIDVIIGGPPCQAFARVGRAKLREVAEHPEAFKHDERAALYLSFVEYIEAFQPLAVVMENVPDVLNYGGHNIAQEMAEALDGLGYVSRYTLLNSALYGVPQMRERMFLVGYARELGREIEFPRPTHFHEFPVGYEGTRQVALKHLESNLFSAVSNFDEMAAPSSDLPRAITARDALEDLPPITLHLEGRLRRGARRFTELTPYPDRKWSKLNDYAKLMRSWRGFESGEGIYDHVIRYLPRDYAIFKRMQPGDQYPEAHRLALKMLDEEVERRLGDRATTGERSSLRRKLMSQIVPPYDPGKFPNKWRKMEPDAPARTLLAHLGKDSYSHIHYDSAQGRTISVREAARLQSFPDGFRFEGTMNPAFRQIGNAVPPLLAKAIASEVRKALPRV